MGRYLVDLDCWRNVISIACHSWIGNKRTSLDGERRAIRMIWRLIPSLFSGTSRINHKTFQPPQWLAAYPTIFSDRSAVATRCPNLKRRCSERSCRSTSCVTILPSACTPWSKRICSCTLRCSWSGGSDRPTACRSAVHAQLLSHAAVRR